MLERLGKSAWLLVGIAVFLWILGQIADSVTIVLFPLVIALFPAAVLFPLVAWLVRHRVPPAAATLLVMVGALGALAAAGTAIVRPFLDELPELVDAVDNGIDRVDELLADLNVSSNLRSVDDLVDQMQDWAAGIDVGGGVLGASTAVLSGVTGVLLMAVALFFYLKDGRRIFTGFTDLLPPDARAHVDEIGGRLWWTVGAYFRGQMLVAFIDAFFIGVGLLILGVPLALPLATLIFLGAFFPIIGAFVTGLLAVLVALADGGLTDGLIVLALILAVQQIEGNILQPLIMSRAISLHPLMVILVVAIGGALLGILGAFLAVPVAAAIARVVDYVREQVDDDYPPGGEPRGKPPEPEPDEGPDGPGPSGADVEPAPAPSASLASGPAAGPAPPPNA